jgi:hypothetical protein
MKASDEICNTPKELRSLSVKPEVNESQTIQVDRNQIKNSLGGYYNEYLTPCKLSLKEFTL